MKRLLLFFLLAAPFFLFAQLQYPATKKGNVVDDYNGIKVPDPYRWLEDDNSDETKAWVKAENNVTFDYLSKIPYRAQWLAQLEAINNYPRYSSPARKQE